MPARIGIINLYHDEPIDNNSSQYFYDQIENPTMIHYCFDEYLDDVRKYDGYIIGGSRTSFADDYEWSKELRKLIRKIYETNIPCLAICYGHQIVADEFGGDVQRNTASQFGFIKIPNPVTGTNSELFHNLPNPLMIYESHHDAVLRAPEGSTQIVEYGNCVQSYVFGSIIGIQAHPEITAQAAIKFAQRKNEDVSKKLNGASTHYNLPMQVIRNFDKFVKRKMNE